MKGNNTDISHRILFEDNHLIIVNKLPSEIVQGDKTGDLSMIDTVKAYIKNTYHKPGEVFLGLVNRIDRPVSGVVLFARTSKALTRMNELLKTREIRKTYWAIVKESPPSDAGELIHYLKKNEAQNKAIVYNKEVAGSQRAHLAYKILARSDQYFLLEIDLFTGRHHQIRAQLSAMGCPIRGDLKYGYPRSNPDASISLHSRSVSFIHPVRKEEITVIAPPPDDILWNYFISNTETDEYDRK
jgi:23S rRNA pseudouridine1911/1915/1917 synthase